MTLKERIFQKYDTLKEFSEVTNIPYQTLKRYCRNDINLSKAEARIVLKIAIALQLDMNVFYRDYIVPTTFTTTQEGE